MKIKKSDDLSEVKKLVRELAIARDNKDHAEKTIKMYQQDLVAWFKSKGRKTLKTENYNGATIQATYVSTTRIDIDEDKLKKALGAKTFKKVTKCVIDKSKLEELIAEGEIDPNVVAQCSTERTSEYIKITHKKEVDE